jgi:hypothetical protein
MYMYPTKQSNMPVLNAGLDEYGNIAGGEDAPTLLLESMLAGTQYAKLSEDELDELDDSPVFDLVREPNNPYDEFAIRVQTKKGRKLGYIPRKQNEALARLMDAGRELYAELVSVTVDTFEPDIEIEAYLT